MSAATSAPHRLTIRPGAGGVHQFVLDDAFDITAYVREALMDLYPDGSQKLYLELKTGELPEDCQIEIVAWRRNNGGHHGRAE